MSIVSNLHKKPMRIISIDSNTNNLAFAVFDNERLITYGKINFKGSDIDERLINANRRTMALAKLYKPDLVAIESAVMVRSIQIAISLSMFVGVIVANMCYYGANVKRVAPLTWQGYINNSVSSKEIRKNLKDKHPDKSSSWISSQIRGDRKQYTMNFVNNKFGISVTDDDIGDAIAVGYWACGQI